MALRKDLRGQLPRYQVEAGTFIPYTLLLILCVKARSRIPFVLPERRSNDDSETP